MKKTPTKWVNPWRPKSEEEEPRPRLMAMTSLSRTKTPGPNAAPADDPRIERPQPDAVEAPLAKTAPRATEIDRRQKRKNREHQTHDALLIKELTSVLDQPNVAPEPTVVEDALELFDSEADATSGVTRHEPVTATAASFTSPADDFPSELEAVDDAPAIEPAAMHPAAFTPVSTSHRRTFMVAIGVAAVAVMGLVAMPGQTRQTQPDIGTPATLESFVPSEEIVPDDAIVSAKAPELKPRSEARRTAPAAVASSRSGSVRASDPIVRNQPAREVETLPSPSVKVAPIGGPASPVVAVVHPGMVTLVGCIEEHDGGLRLTDIEGDAAPKSRSWRSGFLKKRSADVELVDTDSSLINLLRVGQYVAATGTLVDREMRVRSVRVEAGSCK